MVKFQCLSKHYKANQGLVTDEVLAAKHICSTIRKTLRSTVNFLQKY